MMRVMEKETKRFIGRVEEGKTVARSISLRFRNVGALRLKAKAIEVRLLY